MTTALRITSPGLPPDIHPGYRLRRLRGRGGFGQVWEAEAQDGRVVALKFLPCPKGQGAPQELRSVQMVRDLAHPHIIRVEKVWSSPGFLVVAMELADGSLADLLEVYRDEVGTPLPPQHLCPLLAQVAEALDFLNLRTHVLQGRRGTIQHCDVTPGNILLFGEVAKLSDFGLTTTLGSREKAHFRAGTPAYAAPEVFQGRVSDRTDQYALAACYCLLRGGRLPFPDTPADFDAAYTRPSPDLSMLPEAERPALARALAAVPQARWPSCRELIAELERATCPGPGGGWVERRRARRYRVDTGVCCSVRDAPGAAAFPAEVRDVSAGGVRLRLRGAGAAPPVGRRLELTLTNAACGLNLVVWLRLTHCAAKPAGGHEVGGRFDQPLRPEELEALAEAGAA